MIVGNNVSYDSVNEAYCLLMSYVREDGKVGAKYNKDELHKFCLFLAEILKHPENFVGIDRKPVTRLSDGSFKLPPDVEHDGTGLA